MVHGITLAAALALVASVSARAQIDLTPVDSFYEVEGIRVPNIAFRNGATQATYSPPGDWTLSGAQNKLTLTPPNTAQADATIETEPAHETLPPAAEDSIKVYQDWALKLVPREATKVEVIDALLSPMRISDRPMIDVSLSYSYFGQPFRMNVLFMPREKEQLRFRFLARAAEYPSLFQAFRSSLFSIQGL